MEPVDLISNDELRQRFPPVKIRLRPWPYSFSSVKNVTKTENRYVVEFIDGKIAKIAENEIEGKLAKILHVFDSKQGKNFRLNGERHINEESSDDPEDSLLALSIRKRLRSRKRRLSKIKQHDIVNTVDSDYDYSTGDSRMTTSDSRENSLENFIVNTDDEVEAAETTITRRQRKVMRPVTYENEFKIRETMRKKPARAPSVYIPSYKDEDFIKSHCHFCTSCGRSGNVNGNGASPDTTVQLGKEVATKRLLLCQNCSYSQHNSCFSINIVKYLINFETGEFTCSLCNSKTSNKSKDCVNCNRLATNDSKISLRCRTCKRLFHRDCIKKGLTVKLAESVKDENIDELYSKGQCVECLTYFWKLKRKPKAILANREIDGRKEMYVGWQDMSYRHAEWVSHSWIQAVSPHMHAAYERRLKAGKIVPFSQDWLLIDRIVSVEWENKSKNEARRILAVYKDCEYGEAVWDEPPQKDDPILYPDYDIALKRYIQASQVRPPKGIKNLVGKVRTAASVENYQKHAIKSQPEFLKGGTLMQHQLDALNWLLYKWEQAHNCILADDMGLGKTIQIISYLFYLYKKYQIYPFLIVVPNSTATNWVREFEKWASEMTVVPFFGGKVAREIATKYEVFNERGEAKFHALVATYESVQTEPQLQRIFWPALVVDESQRLKNDRTMLYQHLKRLHLDHIVLLSGTPLQNNLRELFNMMHFIRPTDFVGTDAENYDDLKKEQVDELHTKLRPYFLRRTKEEVLKNLPPKYELIVPLSMTILQKELYKQCLSREIYETLAEATGTKRSKGLTSIFVNLRKVLNHPYLLDGVEKRDPNPEQVHKAMIEACAKLKLLHQMLPKLKEKGHRVLIFSTMSRTLDVIEDYLTYEGRRFVRIDGSVGERDRVRAMDSFNNPNSTVEVFLLTTRAGGVGINLTAADTVIIWDSDANPYADLQAISRAHRIGQTNMVIIYRFMTRLTVEEKILQIGKKKMALEHVVVERMKKAEEGENYEDIESILRFGTEALFSDDASADITYDEAAINNLLDREQYKEAAEEQKRKDIEDLEGKAKEQNGLDFGFAKIWQNDGTIEELPADGEDERENNDTNFWEKFLAKQKAEALRKREEKRLAEENLGRGARKRVVTTYKEKLIRSKGEESKDAEFVPGKEKDFEQDDEDEGFTTDSKASTKSSMNSESLPKKSRRKYKRREKRIDPLPISPIGNPSPANTSAGYVQPSAHLLEGQTGIPHVQAPGVQTPSITYMQQVPATQLPQNNNGQQVPAMQPPQNTYGQQVPCTQLPQNTFGQQVQNAQTFQNTCIQLPQYSTQPSSDFQPAQNSQPPVQNHYPPALVQQYNVQVNQFPINPQSNQGLQTAQHHSIPQPVPPSNLNNGSSSTALPTPTAVQNVSTKTIPSISQAFFTPNEELLRKYILSTGFIQGVVDKTNEIWKGVAKNFSVRLASEIFHTPNVEDANTKAIVDEAVKLYYKSAFDYFNLELNKLAEVDRRVGFNSDCQMLLFHMRSELTRKHCNSCKVALVADIHKAIEYLMKKRSEMDLERRRQAVQQAQLALEEQQKKMQEQQRKMLEEQRRFEEQQRKLQEAMSAMSKSNDNHQC